MMTAKQTVLDMASACPRRLRLRERKIQARIPHITAMLTTTIAIAIFALALFDSPFDEEAIDVTSAVAASL